MDYTQMRTVRAVEFGRQMENGSKDPCLVTCSDGPTQIQVVLKLRERVHSRTFSLIAEVVATRLAQALEVPSADGVIVELLPSFEEVARATTEERIAILMGRSAGLNYGSVFLGPGWHVGQPDESAAKRMRPSLVKIFAFDVLICNWDRQSANPNVLRKDNELAVLDHEMTFGHLRSVEPRDFCPEMLGQDPYFGHVFYPWLDFAEDFSLIFDQFSRLPKQLIVSWFRDLPQEWKNAEPDWQIFEEYLLWAQLNGPAIHRYTLSLFGK